MISDERVTKKEGHDIVLDLRAIELFGVWGEGCLSMRKHELFGVWGEGCLSMRKQEKIRKTKIQSQF
jgi:hypothetical protein